MSNCTSATPPTESTGLYIRVDEMRFTPVDRGMCLIQNIELSVPSNTFVSFLGSTGAGKTTLFRIIAGLEPTYVGRVCLDGSPVTGPSRDVQIVFQDYRLIPWMTVHQNISFATRKDRNGRDDAAVQKSMEIVGLVHVRDRWPKTLSGGEAGRVAFARAFVDQPKVLLLDEPFRSLDLTTRFALQDELLRALNTQPATVLMISHSIEDAVFMSDQIHILSRAPMTIRKSFNVPFARPRKRDDPLLLKLINEITCNVVSNNCS